MEKKRWEMTDLSGLMMFALFALCLLAVLLTAARCYGALVRRGEESFACRTAARYVSTRVRQGDQTGGIAVEPFGDRQALVLRQEIDGKPYLTRVYCYDGWLRELFSPESASFAPEDGERLLELADMTFFLRENRLRVSLTLPEGSVEELVFCLQSAGEVCP